MPNGGPTPDCIHCKSYRGGPQFAGQPYCEYHNMRLAVRIRVFCPDYADSPLIDPDPNPTDWLDQVLDRQTLKKSMMYVWLGEDEGKFFHVPLALISEYRDWTEEKFFEEFKKLVDKYENT